MCANPFVPKIYTIIKDIWNNTISWFVSHASVFFLHILKPTLYGLIAMTKKSRSGYLL